MKVLINIFVMSIILVACFKSKIINITGPNQIPQKLYILVILSIMTFLFDLIWSLIIKCEFILSDKISSALKIAMFGVLGYSFLNDAVGLKAISIDNKGDWNHCIIAMLSVIIPVLLHYSFVSILKHDIKECDK